MHSSVKKVGVPAFVVREAPARVSLECPAFLANRYGLGWARSLVIRPGRGA